MENQPEFQSGGEQPQVSSFATRAMNVFMSPGELFDEVSAAPVQTSSWVLPYFLTVIMAALVVFAIMNNPTLHEQAMKPQRDGMQEQIAEGKMTQEQADQAIAIMENPALFFAFGTGAAVLFITGMVFLVPLVLMTGMKAMFGYGGGYKKVLEMYGLAMIIGIPGVLVTLLMMNSMGSLLAQPGRSLLVMDNYDQESFVHNILASIGIFTVWEVAVLGIGVGRVAKAESSRGMMLTFGLWAAWLVIAALLGWGAR